MGAVTRRRVVILGGGLAGFAAARTLEAALSLAEREQVSITLVTRSASCTLTPLLPLAAAGRLSLDACTAPLRPQLTHTTLLLGAVTAIDPQARQVSIEGSSVQAGLIDSTLAYDDLLVCLGAGDSAQDAVPGASEHALTLRHERDAAKLRARLLDVLEAASAEDSARRRRSIATVFVQGASEAGCQLAAELLAGLRAAAQLFPRIEPADVRVVLIGRDAQCLPERPAQMGEKAQALLTQAGVELRLGSDLTRIEADHVVVRSAGGEERIDGRTVIFTQGQSAPALLSPLTRADAQGRVPVQSTLESALHVGVWAAGASALFPDGNDRLAPTASGAIAQGKLAAQNILAKLRNQPTRPSLPAKLQLSPLGPRRAVGRLGSVSLPPSLSALLWAGQQAAMAGKGPVRTKLGLQLLLSAGLDAPPSLLKLDAPRPPLHLTQAPAVELSPPPIFSAPLPVAKPPPPPRSGRGPGSTEPLPAFRPSESADKTLKDPPF